MYKVLIISGAVLLASCNGLAVAKQKRYESYPGPISGTVIFVIDADTIKVNVSPWPDINIKVAVRVRGIDAPESKRAKCPEERKLSRLATNYVRGLLRRGAKVRLRRVWPGKYARRVIADLDIKNFSGRWTSLNGILIASGYAKPYHGGKKPRWCTGSKK